MSTAHPQAPASPAGIWFFSPWLDMLCLGGLSIAAFVPFLLLGVTGDASDALIKLTVAGNVLVNYPHYAATYYRVYPRPDEVRKYRFEAIVAPVILAILCTFGVIYHQTWLPWLVLAYISYSGWHYSGQAFGVAMIFAGKSGLRLNGWARRALVWPIYLALFYALAWMHTPGHKPMAMFGITLPVLGCPPVLTQALFVLVCLSLAGYGGLTLFARKVWGRPVPFAVHMILAAHLVWFAFSSHHPAFWVVVPFFHCLQYLVVTVYCDYKEWLKSDGEAVSAMAYLRSRQFGRYYRTQALVGAALFLGVPILLTLVGAGSFGLMSAVMTCFLNLHHFILDGAIWKLRKPEVSRALHLENPGEQAAA